MKAYNWLVCSLTVDCATKLETELKKGKDGFSAKNDSQMYYFRIVSMAFIEVSIEK